MRFFDAGHLLAQALDVGAVGVGAGGREIGAVVDGINRAQRIARGEDVIQPERSEIVANGLQRIIEGFGNASEIRRVRRSAPARR